MTMVIEEDECIHLINKAYPCSVCKHLRTTTRVEHELPEGAVLSKRGGYCRHCETHFKAGTQLMRVGETPNKYRVHVGCVRVDRGDD